MAAETRTELERRALAVAREQRRQRQQADLERPVHPATLPDLGAALARLREQVSTGRWPHLTGKLPNAERHDTDRKGNSR